MLIFYCHSWAEDANESPNFPIWAWKHIWMDKRFTGLLVHLHHNGTIKRRSNCCCLTLCTPFGQTFQHNRTPKEEISNGNFLQTAANFNCFEQLQLTFSGTFCWWWYWIFLFHPLLHCLLFFPKLLLYTMNFASVCVCVCVPVCTHEANWQLLAPVQYGTALYQKTALGL